MSFGSHQYSCSQAPVTGDVMRFLQSFSPAASMRLPRCETGVRMSSIWKRLLSSWEMCWPEQRALKMASFALMALSFGPRISFIAGRFFYLLSPQGSSLSNNNSQHKVKLDCQSNRINHHKTEANAPHIQYSFGFFSKNGTIG